MAQGNTCQSFYGTREARKATLSLRGIYLGDHNRSAGPSRSSIRGSHLSRWALKRSFGRGGGGAYNGGISAGRAAWRAGSTYVKEMYGESRDTSAAGCKPQMMVRTGMQGQSSAPASPSGLLRDCISAGVNPGLWGRFYPKSPNISL